MGSEDPVSVQSLNAIRDRRDASIWTSIHPVFAIGQLGVFVVSLVLVALYALHVVAFSAVHLSVLIKIAFMVGAVITGSLWERDVYGKWWFAHEFFIEDVMTLNVFLLHVGYLVAVYGWPDNSRAYLAMLGIAYFVYGLNVCQYIASHMRSRKDDARLRDGGREIAA
jgi:3-vinyl bacteriochlorophyllide hydratase